MEYLLYTKKLSVRVSSTSDEHNSMETEVTVNNSELTIYYNVVTNELLSKFNDAFFSNPSNILAQNICTVYDPFEIALSRNRIQDQIVSDHYFSTRIKGCGNPIGDQKYSGRCWIFACLNVIRVPFMKHYNISQFEFSQAHMFFWDKIERCNFFLNGIVSTARNGESLDSRKVMHLLKNPVEDGGYWNMAVNIIKKYGLMPKLSFPESYSSEDSKELNCILNSKLREFAIVLHDMVTNNDTNSNISDQIEKDMSIVFRIVGVCLGIPKQTFKWYYRSSANEPLLHCDITPLDFYNTMVEPIVHLEDKVSLISDPRANNEFGRLYTLDLVGNVTEGSKIARNNQPIEVLLEACKQSIARLGEPVWYSCEVNQRFSNELGLEDLKLHDIESIFGTDTSIPMTKSERILYHDSYPTHAMVLTGFHEENNEVTRWRVENSWGKHNTNMKGYLMMTTEWFKEYVFEVIVDKKLLPQCVLDVFSQEPIVLPVWDKLADLIS
ncbi:bleomycin hydrolase-like [Rhopalosiphum padi]|uniref:bleomycin hydrolase-like n=1 Tax=Rhopalosiphum padi TaxID=40932 RepID=UPI00298DA49F|nr:bleomycin hydrolase-like [Rhopalosiphum padi]